MYVSPEDDYHVHIGSKEYFEIFLMINLKRFNLNDQLIFLKFEDQKNIPIDLKDAQIKQN